MSPTAPKNNPLFDKACKVAQAAQARHGRALLVGGFVRDMLLGLSPKDADLEVYGLEAEALRELLQELGRVDCVGESFRVYKLAWWEKPSPPALLSKGHPPRSGRGEKVRYELDVSLPRRDKKVARGHRGFEVEGDPFATVENAARRRDFTINAILLDPLTMELLDPFDGQRDLESRVLRVVDPQHFGEDSLRVLRAVQFAARFDLKVEGSTAELCRKIDLADLPRERVWGEVEKWLLKSELPSRGLPVAAQLRVLEKLFPALDAAYTRRSDEMESTLDGAAREKTNLPPPQQITLMLAALGMFLGRQELETLLESLGIFTIGGYDVRRKVIVLAGERKRVRDWFRDKENIADAEFRYLSARCEPRLIAKLARARGDEEAADWFWQKMETLGVAEGPPPPLLQGRDLLALGMQPGPRVGDVLQTLWARQLAGELRDYEEAQKAARELLKNG